MNQQSFMFEPHKLARRDDPETSKAAARACKGLRSEHHHEILLILQAAGTDMNADEIAAASGGRLDRHQVGRRLGELAADGRVRKTGRWRLTPKNRKADTYEVVA